MGSDGFVAQRSPETAMQMLFGFCCGGGAEPPDAPSPDDIEYLSTEYWYLSTATLESMVCRDTIWPVAPSLMTHLMVAMLHGLQALRPKEVPPEGHGHSYS
eukprot:8652050-Pyramimonas_sp.AAC.1